MKKTLVASALALTMSCAAFAAEFPAGDPIEINGMEVAGVYLQAVAMDPPQASAVGAGDIHLEADIHAIDGNAQGLETGAWVPYLSINYTLTKKGGDWSESGVLKPMVANDGPHYGINITLDGPGKYEVHFTIAPPPLMRHIDKETAVEPWWQAFEYNGSFNFVGTGKKGGY